MSAASPQSPSAEGGLLVALALDGVGADAASGASAVAELVEAAESADRLGFDALVLDDPLARAADGAPRISAVDALAFVARRTTRIGLVETAWSHYAEPFHVAKAIATLDFISGGRAGLVVDPARSAAADRFFPAATELDAGDRAAQAAEFAAVVGDLWDSWEDGAEIRDVVSGRYVDNTKVHHIDHDGRFFRVKGPLITPRPPQGRPPVFLADGDGARLLARRGDREGDVSADLVRVEATSAEEVVAAIAAQRPADGTRLVVVAVPRPRLAEVLAELATTPGALPGAGAAGTPTLSQRLGVAWQPSRFAASPT
jgi:alkanesulfonate monooxygenase SsuD/methylene tetrahydromethanopterin reductase-like flavin-dependent oxidoreductase (luciferase family)